MANADLVASLLGKGVIDAEDVLALRREVYADGVIDGAEAEVLFRLEHECSSTDPARNEFFVDELTYFFVFRASPRGYVSEDNARLLEEHIVTDGRVARATELELLVKIIDTAERCPQELVLFVLKAVRESVLYRDVATYGSNRPVAGVIEPVDVQIMRRVIDARGGLGGLTVTRAEADLLFDLNAQTIQAENAPGWSDLFVRAIASHLVSPLGPPTVVDADTVLEREAWLEDPRPHHGRFLLEVGRALTNWGAYQEAWREFDPFGSKDAREVAELERRQLSDTMARESISANEAEWLVARLNEDDTLDANERALLAFLKQHSPRIDSVLEDLLLRASV